MRFSGDKIRGPEQKDIANELAAFANSGGGVLVLGVHDITREVVGIPVERLDAVEAMIHQACADSIDPPMAPVIDRLTLPDSAGAEQPVMRIEVQGSLFVHQSSGRFLSSSSGHQSDLYHPINWLDCSSREANPV